MGETSRYVEYLESLAEDRAALAHLRRGLGQPPGTAVTMYPYVAPWVGPKTPRRVEEVYYLVAALYAAHPAAGGQGNMGDHFRSVAEQQQAASAERRFSRLLATHPDDLHYALRQAVSYLKSYGVPVDWRRLLADSLNWGSPTRRVQRCWARSFWSSKAED